MNGASALFGESERRRIAEAVNAAEAKTSAEIVPVVATASGRYDRAEDVVGLIVGLGALITAWLLFQREVPGAGGWGGLGLALPLPALVAIVIGGFIGGALLAARVAWLRRLFVPRGEMVSEVLDRASQVFHDRRVHHTAGSGGVLVYLSLFERRAVVLADQKAFEALGRDSVDEIFRKLAADLRRLGATAALCAAIERLGDLLSVKLPRAPGDRNELADALVTIG